MPEFPAPNPDFTQERALTLILTSIAYEEQALSHIMNAEGEKIQYAISQLERETGVQDMVALNKSVTDVLGMVLQNQMLLKNKMEKVLDFLPRSVNPPSPPIVPIVPQPPVPFVPPQPPYAWNHFHHHLHHNTTRRTAHFHVTPNVYSDSQMLQWCDADTHGSFRLSASDCAQIIMPQAGQFAIDLCLQLQSARCCYGAIKLLACACSGALMEQRLQFQLGTNGCAVQERVYFEASEMGYPSCFMVQLCAPHDIRITGGSIVFTNA